MAAVTKSIMSRLAALAIIGLLFPIAAHGTAYECVAASSGAIKACTFTLAKGDTFKLDCTANNGGSLIPEKLLTKDAHEVCFNDTNTPRGDGTTDCPNAKKLLKDLAGSNIKTDSQDDNGFVISNGGYAGEKTLNINGACLDSGKQNGSYFNITIAGTSATTTAPDSGGGSGSLGTTVGLATVSGLALIGFVTAF